MQALRSCCVRGVAPVLSSQGVRSSTCALPRTAWFLSTPAAPKVSKTCSTRSGVISRANASLAATDEQTRPAPSPAEGGKVRVRFAPSPTGNLHVGGARTALFNWLYAKNTHGEMVLRIEDTDAARSTAESEAAVLSDLKWLGLKWDEGPDVGGPHGPYRQSERREIYKEYVDKLVEQGLAYPCFCSDEELERQREEAEAAKQPPIYRGKWAQASKEEVEEQMRAGTPYCYRFRVPKDEVITIQDLIRGEVSWNTDTLGDFVVLRSNGLPVYNFCVAVDDALMKISHVIRAEEHLPNTLRQVLVYKALGFPLPQFGHVSLILAADKSKLSKRHGATSVGEFAGQGYLPTAMMNFLALLGWNDGTEREMFDARELSEAFSLDRITKSGAVFDTTKLAWMNGQYLRALPQEEMAQMVAEVGAAKGLLARPAVTPFVQAATELTHQSLELVNDAVTQIQWLLQYPLEETLASPDAAPFIEDGFADVARAVVAAHADGSLQAAVTGGPDAYKSWIKGLGKSMKRKGKRLFMPVRIALTGSQAGPDVGQALRLLTLEDGDLAAGVTVVHLDDRIKALQAWLDARS
ncbi:TSX2 [Auxenochlorella protothecoides x Auxenochlorella symbiontica]